MKTSTNIRDIRLTRENATKQKGRALVTRFEMACPGPYVILKDVPYGRAYRMNLNTAFEVKDQNDWVSVTDHDEDTLYNLYTKYDKQEPVIEEIQLEEEKEEEIVEEPTVEEVVEEDESDDENTIPVEEIQNQTEAEAPTTEIEQKKEEVAEEVANEPTVEDDVPVPNTNNVSFTENNTPEYSNNKKNIHYKKKK